MDSKVDGRTWVRVTVITAMIGSIGILGAALIGILPDILEPIATIPPPTYTTISSEETQSTLTTPLPENMLFFDNFDSGTTAKWVNLSSTSSFKDGQIYISNGYLISGSNNWQNYSISAEVKLVSGNIDFSLVARFKDQDHFYSCQFWHDQVWIVITGDNLPQGTFDWLAKNSYKINLGELYKASMAVQGESISCYLNDKLVASAADSTYSTGKFGLRIYDTEAALDNVEVFKLP